MNDLDFPKYLNQKKIYSMHAIISYYLAMYLAWV